MPDQSQSVAVVTGANRGMGREVAQELQDRGYVVVACARRSGDVDVPGVHAHALDVTDDASVRALAERVAAEHGGADVLVNVAGIIGTGHQPVLEADLEEVRAVMDVNLLGPWRMLRAFAGQLRRSSHGRVVNVSTGMASLAEAGTGSGPYRTSKVALNMLTVTAANELRADGVLVNAVCPGWVRTDMGGDAAPRSVAEGAAGIVWAATLPDDGPSGGFFRDGAPIAW